jgi:hypothetical protein
MMRHEPPDHRPRIVSPHRDISQHAMPYCATHNQLYPHATVGWLTPASVTDLALIPARCPRCAPKQEEK